jgi:hypothetical protein
MGYFILNTIDLGVFLMDKKFLINFCCAFTISCVMIFVLCGCQSDRFYQDRAVNKARKFLLENAKELTPSECARIRFENPVLLTSPILESSSAWGGIDAARKAVYVTWHMPERNLEYMVFGVSSARMDDWYPNRVIRKAFHKTTSAVPAAVAAARSYAIVNLQHQLSVADLNRVRFEDPLIVETDFPLTLDPYGDLTDEEIQKLKEVAASQSQYSLVWQSDDPAADKVVFCGLSSPDLAGWTINFAGLISADEVNQHTVIR